MGVTASHSASSRRSASFIAVRDSLRLRRAAAIAALVSANVIAEDTSGVSTAHSSPARVEPSSARNSFVKADESK